MSAEPYLSEVRIFSFVFAPKGWAACNGQFLPINQNQPLFALLGTTYGGNGQTTFALPDLRGRVPIHEDGNHTLGEKAGESAHTLTIPELAAHSHLVNVTTGTADQQYPLTTTYWAAGSSSAGFHQNSNATMDPATVVPIGGSQPHANTQPFLVLNFCIALSGIFPSQN
jgi:microcystin-dependent protein